MFNPSRVEARRFLMEPGKSAERANPLPRWRGFLPPSLRGTRSITRCWKRPTRTSSGSFRPKAATSIRSCTCRCTSRSRSRLRSTSRPASVRSTSACVALTATSIPRSTRCSNVSRRWCGPRSGTARRRTPRSIYPASSVNASAAIAAVRGSRCERNDRSGVRRVPAFAALVPGRNSRGLRRVVRSQVVYLV